MMLIELPTEQLVPEFNRELVRLNKENMTIPLSLSPLDAMVLIAAIQLACRHPQMPASSRSIIQGIVNQIQKMFIEKAAFYIVEFVRRGWLPEFDVKKETQDVDHTQ